MKVSAQYAEEHFTDLLHAADNGEEVEIARAGRPMLVLLQRPHASAFHRKTPRILGEGVGEMVVPSWDEWKAMDKEMEYEGNDRPLVSGAL